MQQTKSVFAILNGAQEGCQIPMYTLRARISRAPRSFSARAGREYNHLFEGIQRIVSNFGMVMDSNHNSRVLINGAGRLEREPQQIMNIVRPSRQFLTNMPDFPTNVKF